MTNQIEVLSNCSQSIAPTTRNVIHYRGNLHAVTLNPQIDTITTRNGCRTLTRHLATIQNPEGNSALHLVRSHYIDNTNNELLDVPPVYQLIPKDKIRDFLNKDTQEPMFILKPGCPYALVIFEQDGQIIIQDNHDQQTLPISTPLSETPLAFLEPIIEMDLARPIHLT